MRTGEHIVLESDERPVPDARAAQRVHAQLHLRSHLRRHALELRLIDYYFLSVRSQRARGKETTYVLDLRHVDRSFRQTRHIAWRWMSAALGMAAVFVASVRHMAAAAVPWWQHSWLPGSALLLALAICAGFVGIYRTTETFMLYSAHGQAKLLHFTAGLGTLRRLRHFAAKLSAHLHMARRNTVSKAEELRHEMRDHFRLKESGVLSNADYEASKLRILRQHG